MDVALKVLVISVKVLCSVIELESAFNAYDKNSYTRWLMCLVSTIILIWELPSTVVPSKVE